MHVTLTVVVNSDLRGTALLAVETKETVVDGGDLLLRRTPTGAETEVVVATGEEIGTKPSFGMCAVLI